jgi:hypothetical protein
MSIIFRGNYDKIKKYAACVNDDGYWRALECGHKQYRTDDGAVLNWWEKSGKITFQGKANAVAKFEKVFIARSERYDRLRSSDGHAVKTIEQERREMRAKIAGLERENEQLRKRLGKLCSQA